MTRSRIRATALIAAMLAGFAIQEARAQPMPKPGGGRCVVYAQQKCGVAGFKSDQGCRDAARRECLSQGKRQ